MSDYKAKNDSTISSICEEVEVFFTRKVEPCKNLNMQFEIELERNFM
jgi:hypothetical protein